MATTIRSHMTKIVSNLGHSYDLGVGHSYDLPPPKKTFKNKGLFFCLLMILGGPKNPQSGRACAPGGSARQEAGDPPPNGRAVEFLASAERPPEGGRAADQTLKGVAPGGTGWGGSGKEGKDLEENSE
jgi:hypothetical protein